MSNTAGFALATVVHAHKLGAFRATASPRRPLLCFATPTCAAHIASTPSSQSNVSTTPSIATDPAAAEENVEGVELHFISKDMSVEGRDSNSLRMYIESELSKVGDPVRWAIVAADEEKGTVTVDAVVSSSAKSVS